jgi:2Fe-2S ferredoxin
MANVTWILPNGERKSVDVKQGTSLMDAAVQNAINGIAGECGGGLMCATCHVYVEAPFVAAAGAAGPMEEDMLDTTDVPRLPQSRLSCQLTAGPELDGIVLRIPTAAYAANGA